MDGAVLMGLRFIRIERFDHFDARIICESRFLWFKPRRVVFVGNCTVWHSYPDGKRVPTGIELWFCDIWKSWKWRQAEGGAS
ncbi:hypothetical protein [Devosia sp. SL43]|uniref:hypothetical protein n=1 Tax=Devosia sp. SL43 TaxID=2806348 RepID=UPI001F2A17BB|nr:hypothetical protein [Devosia sp. SL43]UJW87930.1 hypothetical protein IM737_20830 [Devosia sp. SL43]